MFSRHSFAHPCGSTSPLAGWLLGYQKVSEMPPGEVVLRGAGLHFFLTAGVPGSWDTNTLLRGGTHPASQGPLVPAADGLESLPHFFFFSKPCSSETAAHSVLVSWACTLLPAAPSQSLERKPSPPDRPSDKGLMMQSQSPCASQTQLQVGMQDMCVCVCG